MEYSKSIDETIVLNILSLSNSAILAMDFMLSIDEQKKYFQYYMSRHLFDVDYHLVLQKIFPNASSKMAMEKGFDGTMNPHHLLAMQAYIPKKYFKELFGITTDYQFPSIPCDENGIITGNTENYACFDSFKLVRMDDGRIGVRFYPTDSTKIRDTDIEMFIMQNQIKHIQLNLTSKDVHADFASTQCMVYPKIISDCSAVYDTLYITDYLLKYIYYIFVQMAIYKKSLFETKRKTFLLGIREVGGLYKVSNLEGHTGFLKLLNIMQLFLLKNKLIDNIELKESYAIFGESKNQLNIYINYEDITYSTIKFDDKNSYVKLLPLKASVNMGYRKDGRFEELPLFANYIIQFCNENYKDIKKAFPIFERLENIYRLCAMSGIINYFEKNEDFENFTIEQKPKTIEECVFIDTYASSIMCFGGLVLTPRNFVKVPFIEASVPTPAPFTNKVVEICGIKRGLADAPISVGSLHHAGIMLKTSAEEYHIVEYGPSGGVLRKIKPSISGLIMNEEGHHWTIDSCDKMRSNEYDPEEVKTLMDIITYGQSYDLIAHNCQDIKRKILDALK
jgi:hypothetical protein